MGGFKDEANSLSLFSFLGLIFFGLGNALAVKVKFLGLHPWEVLNMALYQKFDDHWYVECHMWVMSRSNIFTSRSKIYKCRYILNALLIIPLWTFLTIKHASRR